MTPRFKKRILQAGNIIATIITILVNALAVILPLNGKTTQELSDALPNLFVPAGITFSIWSIIYILWIIFAIYQARDFFSKKEKPMEFHQKISVLYILSCVANSAWILFWHYEQIAYSLLTMILLLILLIAIYIRLNIGRAAVEITEKIAVHIPFSVYLGWITIASIANVTAYLVSIQWDGFGINEVTWTILIIIIGALITILMLAYRKDIAYSLVVLWSLLGIYLKQTTDTGMQNDVALTSLLTMILITAGILASLSMRRIGKNLRKRKTTE